MGCMRTDKCTGEEKGYNFAQRLLGRLFAPNASGFASRRDVAVAEDVTLPQIEPRRASQRIGHYISAAGEYVANHPYVIGALAGLTAAGIAGGLYLGGMLSGKSEQVKTPSAVQPTTISVESTSAPIQLEVKPTAADVTVNPIAVPQEKTGVLPALAETAQTSPQGSTMPTAIAQPTAQNQPVQTAPTQPPQSVATSEAKLFEILFPAGMAEGERTLKTRIAQDDWNAVMKAYGLKEGEGRIEIGVNGNGYNVIYRIGDRTGVGGEASLGDFTEDPSDTGLQHPMAHATNYVLISNDIPSWLDEGLAMRASGQTKEVSLVGLYDKNKKDTIEGYAFDSAIELLLTNPEEYWDRYPVGQTPGHAVGKTLYWLLQRRGLTNGKQIEAVNRMRETRKSDVKWSLFVRQKYEAVLGVNLDQEFNALEPAFQRYFSQNN